MVTGTSEAAQSVLPPPADHVGKVGDWNEVIGENKPWHRWYWILHRNNVS